VPAEALELSHALEGLQLKPYADAGGVWTIGYGSTRDLAGKPVTASTPAITQAQAEAMAERDLQHAARLVAEAFPQGLPPRWAAALILMANNLGDIRRWGGSLKFMVDGRQWGEAAYQLRKYRMAAGVPLLGLIRRRWMFDCVETTLEMKMLLATTRVCLRRSEQKCCLELVSYAEDGRL
jgi:lysozyme